MDDPTGSQNPVPSEERGRWLPVAGVVAGAALLMAGVGICSVGVPMALKSVNGGLVNTGIADPTAVANGISHVMYLGSAGASSLLVGLVVLVVSLVAMRREEEGGNQ